MGNRERVGNQELGAQKSMRTPAIYARLGISLRWHPIVVITTVLSRSQSALFQVAFFAHQPKQHCGASKGKANRPNQVQAIAF